MMLARLVVVNLASPSAYWLPMYTIAWNSGLVSPIFSRLIVS